MSQQRAPGEATTLSKTADMEVREQSWGQSDKKNKAGSRGGKSYGEVVLGKYSGQELRSTGSSLLSECEDGLLL